MPPPRRTKYNLPQGTQVPGPPSLHSAAPPPPSSGQRSAVDSQGTTTGSPSAQQQQQSQSPQPAKQKQEQLVIECNMFDQKKQKTKEFMQKQMEQLVDHLYAKFWVQLSNEFGDMAKVVCDYQLMVEQNQEQVRILSAIQASKQQQQVQQSSPTGVPLPPPVQYISQAAQYPPPNISIQSPGSIRSHQVTTTNAHAQSMNGGGAQPQFVPNSHLMQLGGSPQFNTSTVFHMPNSQIPQLPQQPQLPPSPRRMFPPNQILFHNYPGGQLSSQFGPIPQPQQQMLSGSPRFMNPNQLHHQGIVTSKSSILPGNFPLTSRPSSGGGGLVSSNSLGSQQIVDLQQQLNQLPHQTLASSSSSSAMLSQIPQLQPAPSTQSSILSNQLQQQQQQQMRPGSSDSPIVITYYQSPDPFSAIATAPPAVTTASISSSTTTTNSNSPMKPQTQINLSTQQLNSNIEVQVGENTVSVTTNHDRKSRRASQLQEKSNNNSQLEPWQRVQLPGKDANETTEQQGEKSSSSEALHIEHEPGQLVIADSAGANETMESTESSESSKNSKQLTKPATMNPNRGSRSNEASSSKASAHSDGPSTSTAANHNAENNEDEDDDTDCDCPECAKQSNEQSNTAGNSIATSSTNPKIRITIKPPLPPQPKQRLIKQEIQSDEEEDSIQFIQDLGVRVENPIVKREEEEEEEDNEEEQPIEEQQQEEIEETVPENNENDDNQTEEQFQERPVKRQKTAPPGGEQVVQHKQSKQRNVKQEMMREEKRISAESSTSTNQRSTVKPAKPVPASTSDESSTNRRSSIPSTATLTVQEPQPQSSSTSSTQTTQTSKRRLGQSVSSSLSSPSLTSTSITTPTATTTITPSTGNPSDLTQSQFSTQSLKCVVDNCHLMFTSKEDTVKHQLEAHHIQQFLCQLADCSQSFHTKNRLKSHLGAEHPNEQEWKCRYCNIGNQSHQRLDQHIRWNHAKGKFRCKHADCDFVGEYLASVSQHYQITHKASSATE